jgi:hypothetical protein
MAAIIVRAARGVFLARREGWKKRLGWAVRCRALVIEVLVIT